MTNLEKLRVARISTGHVSASTATMLNTRPRAEWPCAGGCYSDYGWFVYAHDENCGEGDQRIPEDLFAVMTWAGQNGCSHILFHQDADEVDGLPFYDW